MSIQNQFNSKPVKESYWIGLLKTRMSIIKQTKSVKRSITSDDMNKITFKQKKDFKLNDDYILID